MRSKAGAAFFEERFVPLVFQTHLSGVVVEELYAGALDVKAIKLVDAYVGSLEREEIFNDTHFHSDARRHER